MGQSSATATTTDIRLLNWKSTIEIHTHTKTVANGITGSVAASEHSGNNNNNNNNIDRLH
jgi:hypothetical protein